MAEQQSEILLYQTEDKQTRIEVQLQGDSVWLTQKQMADLFQKSVKTVNEHVVNVFKEGELSPEPTIRKFRIVQAEGSRSVERLVDTYSLDVIISVGYRVKSLRGTQFRMWATQRLRDYLVKGFALDDAKLKDGGTKNEYFDELLERVRAIRTSEKNFYRKVTDIYATSIDYDEHAEISRQFFLAGAYPEPIERDVLSEATGYQRSSRDAYLQRMGTKRLVEVVGRGAVKASDALFG